MAGFKTHITTSTVVGVGYGVGGFFLLEAPPATCVLSAGLCSVAGILPDLDSDTGRPVREITAFTAAVIPMLLAERLERFGLSREMLAVIAALSYLFIRFGVAEVFKRYTVHRGMWHSIPAALTVTLLAFLACASSNDMTLRLYKSLAVGLGFMVHLILDEIWSIDFRHGRLKKSFGTAIKLWGSNTWGNVSTYAKLIVVSVMAAYDPFFMDQMGAHDYGVPVAARQWLHDIAPDAGFLTAVRERLERQGTASGEGNGESESNWWTRFRSSTSSPSGDGPVAETARFTPSAPATDSGQLDGTASPFRFGPGSESPVSAPPQPGSWPFGGQETAPAPPPETGFGAPSGNTEVIERPQFLPRGFLRERLWGKDQP